MAVIKKCFKNRAAGFTLIELIMVLVLLSILAATAAPYLFRGSSAVTVRAFARKVADDVRYAQGLAMRRSNLDSPAATNPYFLYRINFNAAAPFCAGASQYNITSDADNNGAWGENPNSSGLVESARNPSDGSSFFCISLAAGDWAGYTVAADFGGSVPGVLAFDTLGAPRDSEGAALAAARTITVSKGGESAIVSITPHTGLAVLQ